MSFTMNMTVANNSSQILGSYKVSHEWNGNTHSVVGENLAQGASSSGTTITTGYGPEFDNFDVSVTFANGKTFSTSFYCHSSHGQTAVQIQINNNDCNCVYYKDGGVETGCYNKG